MLGGGCGFSTALFGCPESQYVKENICFFPEFYEGDDGSYQHLYTTIDSDVETEWERHQMNMKDFVQNKGRVKDSYRNQRKDESIQQINSMSEEMHISNPPDGRPRSYTTTHSGCRLRNRKARDIDRVALQGLFSTCHRHQHQLSRLRSETGRMLGTNQH